MLFRLLLLFTVVPLVELWLLYRVAGYWGWPATFVVVLGTGMLGAALARREGLRCWLGVRRRMARGEVPTDALLDGVMILAAGALLITPGMLTDLVGLALLAPPVRHAARRYLARRFQAEVVVFQGPRPPGGPTGRDQVIDARVIDTNTNSTDSDDR